MVKNAGECRRYVGTRGFKSFGKEFIKAAPLLWLRASRALCISDSVMWGFAMRISVRGYKWEWTIYLYDRNLGMSV